MLTRFKLLTGETTVELLRRTSVILFGVGGVGSWCAEALVRSGIGRLTMVDPDLVCSTNINRQVQATAAAVGKAKVLELAQRLIQINPDAEIIARQETYQRDSVIDFDLGGHDYVIDAIDSLSAKVDLIINAAAAGATVFVSLGAAGKIDPACIRVSPLWDSQRCHLGKMVRKRLRRRGFTGNPLCVYSDEIVTIHNAAENIIDDGTECLQSAGEHDEEVEIPAETGQIKKQINGSAVHITGTFGFFLASLVIRDVMKKAENSRHISDIEEPSR